MPRWRQKVNEDGTSTFVPIERPESNERRFIHGDIQSFVSPIDGAVISDRKQYREHCKKHNVVPAQEFSADYYKRAADKRADVFTGRSTREETFQRRREMYEIAMKLERENGNRRK